MSLMKNTVVWDVEFSSGSTKLERFLFKIQHSQKKLLNFENWCNGEVTKTAKMSFKVNFLCQKSLESLLSFFH